MRFIYEVKLKTGGPGAFVRLVVDADAATPEERAFALGMLDTLVAYDREDAARQAPGAGPAAEGER